MFSRINFFSPFLRKTNQIYIVDAYFETLHCHFFSPNEVYEAIKYPETPPPRHYPFNFTTYTLYVIIHGRYTLASGQANLFRM